MWLWFESNKEGRHGGDTVQGTILQLIDDLLRLNTPLNNSLYYFMKNYCNLIGLEQLSFSLI